MKVVNLLKAMLATSETEGKAERVLYAKLKCYCDQTEREKKDSIESGGALINLLGTEIAELKGSSGLLKQEVAKLEADMRQNKASQKAAEENRETSKEVFEGEEEDMENAIAGFKQAKNVLAEITGSFVETGDRKKLRAHSQSLIAEGDLSKAQDVVRGVVAAISSQLTAEQRAAIESFLQAPSAQSSAASGAIVKILEQMITTFEDNLKNAQDAEVAEKKAYKSYEEDLEATYTTLEESRDGKNDQLATQNDALASKEEQLGDADEQLEEDEDFFANFAYKLRRESKGLQQKKNDANK